MSDKYTLTIEEPAVRPSGYSDYWWSLTFSPGNLTHANLTMTQVVAYLRSLCPTNCSFKITPQVVSKKQGFKSALLKKS